MLWAPVWSRAAALHCFSSRSYRTLAPAVFWSSSCAGNGKKLQGKTRFFFFLFKIEGGLGNSLLSQDKVTPPSTQATPLLSMCRSWVPGLQTCLPSSFPSQEVPLSGRENRIFFFFWWGEGPRPSENPNKGLPPIQPFNHLPELKLSSK